MTPTYFQQLAAKHNRNDSVVEYAGFNELPRGTVVRLVCQGSPANPKDWVPQWGALTAKETKTIKELMRQHPVGSTVCDGRYKVRGYAHRPQRYEPNEWRMSLDGL
jgi:hypothetical protein